MTEKGKPPPKRRESSSSMSEGEAGLEDAEEDKVPEEREEEKQEEKAPELLETPFVKHLKEVGGKREIEVLDIMRGLDH